jgi:hypothetical protein
MSATGWWLTKPGCLTAFKPLAIEVRRSTNADRQEAGLWTAAVNGRSEHAKADESARAIRTALLNVRLGGGVDGCRP